MGEQSKKKVSLFLFSVVMLLTVTFSRLREPKIREFYERMFPEIRKQREREERIQRCLVYC